MQRSDFRRLIASAFLLFCFPLLANAQTTDPGDSAKPVQENSEELPEAPEKVNVNPTSDDSDISTRLTRILEATEWFQNPEIHVDEGVAFLSGSTDDEKYRTWAADLAGNTEDVVAVVNRIEVQSKDIWDLSPAIASLESMGRDAVQSIPNVLAAVLIVLLTFLCMYIVGKLADHTLLSKIDNNLIRGVIRKAILALVFLFGMYLVLRVAGLTRLAATVIGGTGIFGLIVGIAFRDIAENFLASILISMQNPSRYGDLIEVEGLTGYVQRVNTRGTLLMSMDGNHIQIPNATVYKSTIKNFSSNPNTRLEFVVGIGYDASISKAQNLIIDILRNHSAVLDDPEPIVLVDELGASTVNLRIYYWINSHEYSHFKVQSSVMRRVTTQLDAAGISMPDDAREVIFPHGVPVQMISDESHLKPIDSQIGSAAPDHDSTEDDGEEDLQSEAAEIHKQAELARDPDEGDTDLLESRNLSGAAT